MVGVAPCPRLRHSLKVREEMEVITAPLLNKPGTRAASCVTIMLVCSLVEGLIWQ